MAELLDGTPGPDARPVRSAFAYGGKDEAPFAVDRETCDRTIETLNVALTTRDIRRERMAALRLSKLAG